MAKSNQSECLHENLGPCHLHERRVHAQKGEGVSAIKRGKRGGMGVHTGTTEERIHLTLKVASDSASIFCRKEEQKEIDGAGLQVFK